MITPARNEESFIEGTIKSVISQTLLPQKWIIVSDASTDNTDNIVKEYADKYDWIELVRMPEERDRSFAAKVSCFNTAYQKIAFLDFDVIGNLDADITFDSDYMVYLIEKFIADENLGVAGTPFIEDGYDSTQDSFEGEKHVAGGCQLFRRKCFKDIGGYKPIKGGGIDWVAVTTARMKGWNTKSFNEKYFFHHRTLGTSGQSNLAAMYDYGKKDWFLGGHPLWQFFRVFYRIFKKPYFFGGLFLFAGYFSGMLSFKARPISKELIVFHRKEQMKKLKLIVKSLVSSKKNNKFDLGS